MRKGAWKSTYNIKTELFPKPHRDVIAGGNKIEHHTTISSSAGELLRVNAHSRRHTLSPGRFRYDVTAVTHVAALTWEIGFEIVRAHYLTPIIQGDVSGMRDHHPRVMSLLRCNAARERVGFTGAKDGLQQRPDERPIAIPRFDYLHHAIDL